MVHYNGHKSKTKEGTGFTCLVDFILSLCHLNLHTGQLTHTDVLSSGYRISFADNLICSLRPGHRRRCCGIGFLGNGSRDPVGKTGTEVYFLKE